MLSTQLGQDLTQWAPHAASPDVSHGSPYVSHGSDATTAPGYGDWQDTATTQGYSHSTQAAHQGKHSGDDSGKQQQQHDGGNDEEDDMVVLQSRISQVKDVLPEYGDGFVAAALAALGNGVWVVWCAFRVCVWGGGVMGGCGNNYLRVEDKCEVYVVFLHAHYHGTPPYAHHNTQHNTHHNTIHDTHHGIHTIIHTMTHTMAYTP